MTENLGTRVPRHDLGRAALFGVAVAWSLSTLILVAKNTGISPLPAPLGVAFTHKLFGSGLGPRALLPVGLLLHTLWVMAGTAAYVAGFRHRLTFANAALVATGMWLTANIVFAPAAGWGLFAARQGADVAVALVATHALFAVFAWALCRTALSPAGDRSEAAVVATGRAMAASPSN